MIICNNLYLLAAENGVFPPDVVERFDLAAAGKQDHVLRTEDIRTMKGLQQIERILLRPTENTY